VEHSIPSSELVRPWRTATLVATGIAGLELVLLVAAGMVLLGKSVAPHVHAAAARQALAPKPAASHRAPAAKPHRVPQAVARLPRRRIGVLVLNGNGVPGAAAAAAARVKARGYPVKKVGNAPRTGYARTSVFFAPGYAGEARRFARDLSLRQVGPLDGMKPRQLHGARLVLLLGATS
jgi:hypothetical protein